ncbi:hypothetical protein RSAG8_04171, partial [Rhizoctonia solani AG-8 WAC10335]
MSSRGANRGSNLTTPRKNTYSKKIRSVGSVSRPPTSTSRASTSRPTTAASTVGDCSNYVVAVLEGRGVAREIGMAALDKTTGQCIIFQIPDCQTYVKTLHHLRLHNPSSILVPDTFLPIEPTSKSKISPLVESISDEFGDEAEMVPIPRKYWNDNDGLDLVNRLIIDNGEKPGTILALSKKYYALSAVCALFKFVEMRMNTTFAPRSVRICFRSPEGTMMIDCETTRNLELLHSNLSKKSKNSLFGLLNHTFTPMAYRLLRVNILAPITDQMAIERRLEVVQELNNDEEKYTAIRDALKLLRSIDFDKLIAQLSTSDTHPVGGPSGNARGASARVEQIMKLRNVVRSLPEVIRALQGCRSNLLRMMADMLDDERVKSIDDMISQGLNDDAMSAGIGLLDMLWSFAHTSILHNYTRPEFTGTLAIKSGRHPVLETVQVAGNFVPNDTYACDGSSFQIIEGPNMSGKSTYLRQIGTLVVMAMCGCFVPAEYASFRIHDALLTRLSNDDDPERSLSTFAKEMTTSSMILSVATDSSLILIDELGRGTSPIEGVGLAHAIAEEIIKIKAFTFFTTHFHQLTYTLSKYPTVVNLHLAVEKSTRADQSTFRLRFRHLLMDGASDAIDHYGLELARLADLSPGVLTEARRVSTKLKAQDDAQRAASESNAIAARRKIILRVGIQIEQALEHSTLEDEDLLKYLEGIQTETIIALRVLLPSVGHALREDVDPSEAGHAGDTGTKV